MSETGQKSGIDDNYTEHALDQMRKAVRGNGVRADDVSIKNFYGGVLEFTATTNIELSNQISEKIESGKVQAGKIFENSQTAREAAEDHVAMSAYDVSIAVQIKKLVSERGYKGFGLNDESVKLFFLDQEFVSHESCLLCHGKGLMSCDKCRGKGYLPCPHCHAEGFEVCHECDGNRQVRSSQGGMQTCTLCHGLGKTSCSYCRESKKIQCPICKTKGKLSCNQCGGHGVQSHIISTVTTAQCGSDFEMESLPDKARALITGLGAGLAEQAQISPVADSAKEGEQEMLALRYKVRLSQGDIEFSVKGKVVQAYLFGIKGEIKKISDFLDKMIAPGIKRLEQVASDQESAEGWSAAENICSAVRYRTVKQAVVVAARYSSKKAVKAVLHYNPLGLSEQAAQKLVSDANDALNNVTERQQQIAMVVGVGSVPVLGALYFLSPLRTAILNQIANVSFYIAVDLVIMAACAGIGYCIRQVIATRARKKAISNFTDHC